VFLAYIRWVHRPTRDGSEDVHAAGKRVSTDDQLKNGRRQLDDILAAASPWRIEKLETEAVIEASLFVSSCTMKG
jgi:hypothetical protein